MRIVNYPSVGEPADRVRDKLDELLMFAEAAISVTNVRRWAQQQALSKALARSGGNPDGSGFVSLIPESLRESGAPR